MTSGRRFGPDIFLHFFLAVIINLKTIARAVFRFRRLCCTNGVGDSLFESSGVAMFYEQLVPYDVQDQELAFVQHGAEAARFAIDLV